MLASIVEDEVLERIPAVPEPPGREPMISLAQLAGYGIRSNYDPGLLQLSVTVPPEKQRTRSLSLNNRGLYPVGIAQERAYLSAFVNLRAKADLIGQKGTPGDVDSIFPLELTFGPAVNTQGTVVEAGVTAILVTDYRARLDYALLDQRGGRRSELDARAIAAWREAFRNHDSAVFAWSMLFQAAVVLQHPSCYNGNHTDSKQ